MAPFLAAAEHSSESALLRQDKNAAVMGRLKLPAAHLLVTLTQQPGAMAFKRFLRCRVALQARRQPRAEFARLAPTFLKRHAAQPPLYALLAGSMRRRG